jgi:hypothetical protein
MGPITRADIANDWGTPTTAAAGEVVTAGWYGWHVSSTGNGFRTE